MAVNYKPEGIHTVTPHLIIKDASGAIEFYKKAFGAEELCRMPGPGGKVMHAELQIGDSRVFVCDEFPEHGAMSPLALNGTPITLHMYVKDADAAFGKAAGAGATVVMPLMDAPWGDRYGKLKDPYGHNWAIATHIEDVSPEEMERRMAGMCKE